MRKFLFSVCVLLFIGFGMLIAPPQKHFVATVIEGLWPWGLIGVYVGAFATSFERPDRKASATRRRRRARPRPLVDGELDDAVEDLEKAARYGGQGASMEEMIDNYWRDRGHPPFMNPDDYDPRA